MVTLHCERKAPLIDWDVLTERARARRSSPSVLWLDLAAMTAERAPCTLAACSAATRCPAEPTCMPSASPTLRHKPGRAVPIRAASLLSALPFLEGNTFPPEACHSWASFPPSRIGGGALG